jgi:hypothetical protein
MRITARELRRTIRAVLAEAPLADIYPPRQASGRPVGHSYVDDEDNEGYGTDFEKSKKVFASKSFREKFKKLTAGWPMDVWVAPAVMNDYFEDSIYRVLVIEPDSVETSVKLDRDPDVVGVVKDWVAATGAHGTLIIPYAGLVTAGVEVTPWIVVHAMFDNEGLSMGRSGVDLRQAYKISELVDEAVELINTAALTGSDSSSRKSRLEAIADVEKVFTMGSARKSYFSKGLADRSDIRNEAAVQAVATTKGFRYDAEALERIKSSCDPSKVPSVDRARKLLDRAVAMSPGAREEFMREILGKVIIINVT